MSNNKRLDWNEYFMSIAKLTSVRGSYNQFTGWVLLLKINMLLVWDIMVFTFFPHESICNGNHEQATVHTHDIL